MAGNLKAGVSFLNTTNSSWLSLSNEGGEFGVGFGGFEMRANGQGRLVWVKSMRVMFIV